MGRTNIHHAPVRGENKGEKNRPGKKTIFTVNKQNKEHGKEKEKKGEDCKATTQLMKEGVGWDKTIQEKNDKAGMIGGTEGKGGHKE